MMDGGDYQADSSRAMDADTNEAALLALMEKTGYSMLQENGQRKYGGPPPGWKGGPPPRGCEVFAGKIPRDMYEDELVPLFSKAGHIYELRLMMEFSGENRGYAFVMYTTKEAAQRAIQLLDNYEIRPGRTIGVCVSLDNCRLFIGSVPRDKKKEEILEEMEKVTDGVVDVIIYPGGSDKSKHRGFAFIEYKSHKAAAMARRKLIPGAFQLWGHTIQVDWAEPERDVDEETMQRVKVLYVRNLMLGTTEETLRQEFSKVKPGSVERVKKVTDYAFVHYRDREDALSALRLMDRANVDGACIQVSLAKPSNSNKFGGEGGGARSWGGRGYLGNRTSAALGGAAGGDGALRREDGGMTGGGGGGRGDRPRRPQSLPPRLGGPVCFGPGGAADGEHFLFPCLPGTPLSSTSLCYLKPSQLSSAVSLLELYCDKNNWPLPEYHLYSAPGPNNQLYLIYKVCIPSINSSFMPDKLCMLVENAKELAAQNALWSLECSFVSGGGSHGSPPPVVVSTPPSPPVSSSSGGGGAGGLLMFGGRGGRPISCLSPPPPPMEPMLSPRLLLPPAAQRHYNIPPQSAFY